MPDYTTLGFQARLRSTVSQAGDDERLAGLVRGDLHYVESYLSLVGADMAVLIIPYVAEAAARSWTPRIAVLRNRLRDIGLPGGVQLDDAATAEEVGHWAEAAVAAIEGSPLPDKEWTALHDILGDLLPGLVGVSASSAGRYRSGARTTPDAVAARLHVLTLIVSDLSGSYNDFGIRRWFQRPRAQLDGRAPADILTGEWDPDSGEVRRVRDLAAWLTGQVSRDPVPQR